MNTITEQENNKQKELATTFDFVEVMDSNGKPKKISKEDLENSMAPSFEKGQKFNLVNVLPPMGVNGYIYLVKKENSSNIYTQYIWNNTEFVNIGDTNLDLSNVDKCLKELENINKKIDNEKDFYGVEMNRGQLDPVFQTWVGNDIYKSTHPILSDFCLAKVKDGKIIGFFDKSNIFKMQDGTDSNIIVDGSIVKDEGWDVMLVNTRGFYAVLGGSDDLIERHLVSYMPFSYKGDVAEYIEPFAITPDFTIVKDGVQRCIRDNSFDGTHAMGTLNIAAFGEKGYPTTAVSRFGYEEAARKKNTPDKTDSKTNIPYAATFHHDMLIWQTLMFIKFRTKDYHSQKLCGGGLSANDGQATEATWGKKTGLRTRANSGEVWTYRSISYADWTAINGNRPNLKMLDSVLALSYAKEKGYAENEEYAYDNATYKYKNIPSQRGLADGELTGIVTKMLKSVDENTEICFVQPIVRGCVLFYGNIYRWVSGIEVVQDKDKATAKIYTVGNPSYLDTSKDDLSKSINDTFEFQKIYKLVGERNISSGYTDVNFKNAIFAERNGASLHTGECHYSYMDNNGKEGKLDRRGVRFGAILSSDYASFGYSDSNNSPSYSALYIGGGFRVTLREA